MSRDSETQLQVGKKMKFILCRFNKVPGLNMLNSVLGIILFSVSVLSNLTFVFSSEGSALSGIDPDKIE